MSTVTPIHPQTRLGPVELTASSLDRLLPFYQDFLGLRLQQRAGERAELGAGGDPLLRLIEQPEARRVRGTTGLYHFAVRYPDPTSLGVALRRLQRTGIELDGAADHGVSLALYLHDPDGNGVELYCDRLEAEWPRNATGGIEMYSRPLDFALLNAG